MEFKNIEELLAKYWAGETDLQEESTLKKYFAGADVHPSLKQYQALFTYYTTSREDKSLDSIDAAVLEHIQGKAVPKQAKVRSLSRVLSIAAAILVLLGAVSVFWNANNDNNVKIDNDGRMAIYTGESEDLEEAKRALIELKAALALVSNKLDDGKRQAIKGISKTKTIPTLRQ